MVLQFDVPSWTFSDHTKAFVDVDKRKVLLINATTGKITPITPKYSNVVIAPDYFVVKLNNEDVEGAEELIGKVTVLRYANAYIKVANLRVPRSIVEQLNLKDGVRLKELGGGFTTIPFAVGLNLACIDSVLSKLTAKKVQFERARLHRKYRKRIGMNLERWNGVLINDLLTDYDAALFGGAIAKAIKNESIEVLFNDTTDGSESGFVETKGKQMLLHLNVSMFKRVTGKGTVGGKRCACPFECLMLVFEHELIHILQRLFCSERMGHELDFKRLARQLWGLKTHLHSLRDPVYIAKVEPQSN